MLGITGENSEPISEKITNTTTLHVHMSQRGREMDDALLGNTFYNQIFPNILLTSKGNSRPNYVPVVPPFRSFLFIAFLTGQSPD